MIMATARKLPDLVNDSRLLIELHETHAHYFNVCNNTTGQLRRRAWEKETWTRTERLGGGATGEVWLEECHTGEKMGQVRAVKVISKGSHFDVYQELETIAKFSQSTSKYEGLFVKSLGWYENDITVFLVMEHIEHGSLASHLTHPLSENEAKQITVQILEGLACFHENEFVHRDVKPDNILVASKDPEWWVKIGDFGFSKRTSEDNSLHSFVGTQKYFAPEVLGLLDDRADPDAEAGGRYRCTYPMDMWSLGVTVFYMLCHDYPFHGIELLEYLKGAPFPITRLSQRRISQEGCAFIKALLTADPDKRLTAAVALEDTWLKGYRNEVPSGLSEKIPSGIINRSIALPSMTDASASWPMSSTWSPTPTRKEQAVNSVGAISEPERIVGPPIEDLHIRNPQQKTLDELGALHKSGLRFIADKNYSQAEDVFQQAADGRKTILGPHHKDRVESMQQLGVTYFFQRRYQDAQKKLQFAVDVQTDTLGTTHLSTLTSSYWLSSLHLAQGKLDASREIIERTMEIQKEILGVQKEDTIKSIYLCGQIYCHQERYNDALELFEQAADSVPGNDYITTLEVHQSLAFCLYKMKRYKEAQSVLEQIIQASPLAPELDRSVDLLFDVGQSLYQAKGYTDAQSAFEKVSEHRKELLGPSHKQTVDSTLLLTSSLRMQQGKVTQAQDTLNQLLMIASTTTRTSALEQLHEIGETLWYTEAYEDAYFTFQEVLEKRRVLLGKKHRDTLRSGAWLGRSLLRQGRYDEAAELLESIENDQDGLNPYGHLETTYTRLWLSLALHYQGQSKLGHAYILPIHQIFKRKLGESHKDTSMCLRYTGSSYGKVKDYSTAERMFDSALSIAKTVFGSKHEETIRTQINLGITLYWRKSYTRSLEHFHPAADARTAVLGESHEDTLETLCCIGATLDALKRYKESERYLRSVVDGRKKLLGANHPETQTAERSLGLCLAHQGRWRPAADIQEQILKTRQETLGHFNAATIQSKHDVETCRKALAGKWFIPRLERMQLDYRHL